MKLDQFLKFHGLVSTGGEAKILISKGEVRVNGLKEKRRGRKLVYGDCISFADVEYIFSDCKP